MQPTKERNPSSIFVNYETENLLFDCGEGTQRQMRIAGLKPTKITRVFISHYHGDHVFGIPGLLANLNANEYNKILHIYGPKGIEKFMEMVIQFARIKPGELKIELHEIKEGKIFDSEKFYIDAYKLNHSTITYGFVIQEKDKRKINLDYLAKYGLKQHPILGDLQKGKDIIWEGKKISAKKATTLISGKKVGIIFDTGMADNCIAVGKNADLLICECTFSENEKEKAENYKHLTVKQSATIAKKSKAKKLILTHFSQRYKTISEIKKEAENIFKNVECAEDFKEVIV